MIFYTDNLLQFKRIMTAVCVYEPELFLQLFEHIDIEHIVSYGCFPSGGSGNRYEFSVHSKQPAAGAEPQMDPYKMRMLENFVDMCRAYREDALNQCTDLQRFLRDLYESDAVNAIMFLLKRADDETIRRFAKCHLGNEASLLHAVVDIIVRKNDNLERMTGNIGHYIIYTCKGKDGEEKLLKFTNQASTVYYLMFLIGRCHQDRLLPFVELRMNQEPFLELYRQVYDEHETTLLYKFKTLLQREESGRIRAGRLHEIVYDIRKHLDERFKDYGEDFRPYAMTASHHLTIGAEHIYFEGEAKQLLQIDFK